MFQFAINRGETYEDFCSRLSRNNLANPLEGKMGRVFRFLLTNTLSENLIFPSGYNQNVLHCDVAGTYGIRMAECEVIFNTLNHTLPGQLRHQEIYSIGKFRMDLNLRHSEGLHAMLNVFSKCDTTDVSVRVGTDGFILFTATSDAGVVNLLNYLASYYSSRQVNNVSIVKQFSAAGLA